MSFTPEDSAIRITPEIEKVLATASAEQIKEIMAQASVDQSLCIRDRFSPDILLPTELASAAPRKVGKVVILNGVKHSLTADDEAGLLAQENALYREVLTQPVAPAATTPARDAATGRFTTPEDAAAQSELELRWRRGELSSEAYLTESGALNRALKAEGIDPEALREASGQKQQKLWADSVTEFLQSEAGRSWPGGERNKQTLGEVLIEMGATDSPSADTIARAYAYMRENDLVVENPDTAYQRELSEARSAQDVTAVNQKYFGGGLFNR